MSGARKVTIEFLGKDVSAGKTATDVEKRFGKLGGTMDKVGQTAGKVLVGGAVLAGAALFKMSQSAADDEQAQAKLATQLKNSAGANDKQVAAVERWITAQGKATGITDDQLRPALMQLVNVTHDVGKAQRLASLAQDVAAGTGKSYESVVSSLVKAQNGSISGLSRLGIQTKNAKGETLSLKQVTQQMADTYRGAAAKAAETTAGKQKILTTQMSELGEQIGGLVLPVMEKMTTIGLELSAWVSKHTHLVGALIGVVGGLLAILWAASAAMRAWSTITKVWSAVTKIAAAAQWLLNAAMEANPIGLVVIAIGGLVAALVIAYKKSETFRKIVNAAFNAVKSVASSVFGWIKSFITGILSDIAGAIKTYAGAYLTVFRTVFGVIKSVVSNVWEGIKSVVSNGWSWLVDAIRSIPGKIMAIDSMFLNAGKHLINAFIDGLKNAGGLVADIAGNVWDAVKGLLNDAISKINSALEFTIDLPFGKHITINPPDIPYLASGTRNFAGGLAIVGERGPELVALPAGSDVFSNGRSRQMMSGGGDITVTAPIVLQLDSRTVWQGLLQVKRQNGKVGLGLG